MTSSTFLSFTLLQKEFKLKSGIYQIKNLVTAQCYIGSSNNILERWYHHKISLNTNSHYNTHLQRSWKKHGENCFEFRILECCSVEDLVEIEQFYIDLFGFENLYNICPVVAKPPSRKGCKMSEKARQKMSASKKGKQYTLGHKQTQEHINKRVWKSQKPYHFISPEGAPVFVVGLSQFCRKYGLHVSGMIHVNSGKYTQSKGWTKYV